jgi:hypothetical protein
MIVSDKICKLDKPLMWLGGGHPDLKLGLKTTDMVKSLSAIVGDITL